MEKTQFLEIFCDIQKQKVRNSIREEPVKQGCKSFGLIAFYNYYIVDKPAGLIFNGVYYMVYVYIVYYIVQSKAVSALCYISGKQTLQEEEWQRSGPCINVSAAPPINTINTFWGQQRCFHIYGSVDGEAEITKHVSRVKANLL